MNTRYITVTSLWARIAIVYSTVYSGADQRKHQSSASLAFVRGIHRRPVNFPHKWPVTRKMFPFDDVIMIPIMARYCIWRSSHKGRTFMRIWTYKIRPISRSRGASCNISSLKIITARYRDCTFFTCDPFYWQHPHTDITDDSVIAHSCLDFKAVVLKAWKSICTPLIYVDGNTYPCPNTDASKLNPC